MCKIYSVNTCQTPEFFVRARLVITSPFFSSSSPSSRGSFGV